MNLTESQKQKLIEFTGRKIRIRPYSWTTGNDMVAVKDKLGEKGLWEEFDRYAEEQSQIGVGSFLESYEYILRLFRHVDEKGEAHFCWLVAEFLEGRK